MQPDQRAAVRHLRARILAIVLAVTLPGAAHGVDDEILETYERFVAAQNSRDVDRIRDFLSTSPDFLWVSDGKSFWGRERTLQRMASFQRAEVWRVEPDLGQARIVDLGLEISMLNLPLTLVIGRAEDPNRIPFLVSILFRRSPGGWTIESLLTTIAKP